MSLACKKQNKIFDARAPFCNNTVIRPFMVETRFWIQTDLFEWQQTCFLANAVKVFQNRLFHILEKATMEQEPDSILLDTEHDNLYWSVVIVLYCIVL